MVAAIHLFCCSVWCGFFPPFLLCGHIELNCLWLQFELHSLPTGPPITNMGSLLKTWLQSRIGKWLYEWLLATRATTTDHHSAPWAGKRGKQPWRAYYYQLGLLLQPFLFLSKKDRAMVTQVQITSELDYCKMLCFGLPLKNLEIATGPGCCGLHADWHY